MPKPPKRSGWRRDADATPAERARQVQAVLLEHSTGLSTDAQFVERLMAIEATDDEIEAAQQALRGKRGEG